LQEEEESGKYWATSFGSNTLAGKVGSGVGSAARDMGTNAYLGMVVKPDAFWWCGYEPFWHICMQQSFLIKAALYLKTGQNNLVIPKHL